jgi:hypothetical protein
MQMLNYISLKKKRQTGESVGTHFRGAGFPARLFLNLADGRLESLPHR